MNLNKLINEEVKLFLNEKLANVDDDVNFIYDTYFAESVKRFNESGVLYFDSSRTDTSILKTSDAVSAHNVKPCLILINPVSGNFNYYNPYELIIGVGVNRNAIEFIKDSGGLENAVNSLPPKSASSLPLEFTEEKLKGSIHHELAHWIDDALHNGHIKNDLDWRRKNSYRVGNVNATKFEIEGQIHNVKQLKNKFEGIWDEISFSKLVDMSPTLKNIYNNLSGDVRIKWVRDLKTRMYREGLLGKKMIN